MKRVICSLLLVFMILLVGNLMGCAPSEEELGMYAAGYYRVTSKGCHTWISAKKYNTETGKWEKTTIIKSTHLVAGHILPDDENKSLWEDWWETVERGDYVKPNEPFHKIRLSIRFGYKEE